MSRGHFRRAQSPMLTVEPDTDNSRLDRHRQRAIQSYARNPKKQRCRRRVPFVQNPKWRRCFAGRSDYGTDYS